MTLVKRAFRIRGFLQASALSLTVSLAVAFAGTAAAAQLGAPFGAAKPAAPAAGQGGMTIAAVVNEDIITVFDVQSRMGMVMVTSGLENTADIQRRLMPQVVDALIEERLKLQEAARLKIQTTEAEIRQQVDQIELRNNMPIGTFRTMLTSNGVDLSALYAQMESDISWSKVVRESLRSNVKVSEDEVNAVLARAKGNQGKPEFLLAEIQLPVNAAMSDSVVRDMATRLVQQARGGTPFPALAQQFSQGSTAVLGGDLGWVVRGDMEPELEDAVTRMEPNQISDPIRTANGYHILALRDRRISGASDPAMSVVTLSQIYLPTIGGRALSPQRLAELSNTISGLTSCEQMNKLAEELETPGSGPIQPVYAGSLPEKVRDAVYGLKPGRTSPAIEVGGARLFLQVCMRRDDNGVPSEQQIVQTLENEKLQNLARQRLRDLRRQALIDVRL